MQISITVDSSKANKRISAAFAAMKNFKEPLTQSKEYILQEVKSNFDTEGVNITGSKWAKRRRSYKHPILNKTGKLKRSFKQTKLTNKEMHIDSSSGYYKYHQLGTSKMPQRQILGFSEKMKNHIVSIFQKFVQSKIK